LAIHIVRSVDYRISKLISRVKSENVTLVLCTRVLISDIPLPFVCESYVLIQLFKQPDDYSVTVIG
jgi:hypothetical protein